MSNTRSGRGHAACATAALVAIGLLAAVPPGQSAPAGRWGPVEKIAVTANPYSSGHGAYFDPIYAPRARPALVDVRVNGSAVTAWIAPHPTPWRLLVSRRSADGGWRGAHDLSSGMAGRLGAFDLAVGGPGSASVVWSSSHAGKSWIVESHLAGETWSAPVRVGRGTAPLTSIDDGGVTTLAWTHRGVWVAQRAAHQRQWNRPTSIARQPVGEHFTRLQLASDSSGDVAVAWEATFGRWDGNGNRVVAALRPHGSASWTTPATLDTTLNLDSVRLAMDGSGRALAMWSGLGDQNRDYAGFVAWARSTPRGQWSTRRDVTHQIGEWGGLVDLSMNTDGLAVASWLEILGGSDGESSLWAARFGKTGTWGAPTKLIRGQHTWGDALPWMDGAGVAHLVCARGRTGIWTFSQEPGAAWRGGAFDHGSLIDATGVDNRLVMVFYRKHALRSRILDVR